MLGFLTLNTVKTVQLDTQLYLIYYFKTTEEVFYKDTKYYVEMYQQKPLYNEDIK